MTIFLFMCSVQFGLLFFSPWSMIQNRVSRLMIFHRLSTPSDNDGITHSSSLTPHNPLLELGDELMGYEKPSIYLRCLGSWAKVKKNDKPTLNTTPK